MYTHRASIAFKGNYHLKIAMCLYSDLFRLIVKFDDLGLCWTGDLSTM